MTIILELPPEIEAEVTTEAAQSGLPLSDYIMNLIERRKLKATAGTENYFLSESALAKDWLRPEEDEAWQHL